VIWGKTSSYTGSNTDIQKEKRMSEWQRAMMLSPQQREMVQARMIADPYDRTASTRLERINSRVNADPYVNSRTSQAFRDALAMREYEQPQSYSASGESDNGYARAQRRAAQSGGQFDPMNDVSVGEVNGRRVVAPQAGRYNAYSAALAQLGLGDSPSPEAYSFAVDQARQRASIDPNKKYESDAKVRAAQVANQSKDAKLKFDREKMQSQERQTKMKVQAKQYGDANKAIDAVSGDKAYADYLKSFRGQLSSIKDMDPGDAKAYFEGQGLPYSEAGGRFVPLPKNKWVPGLGGDNPNIVGDKMEEVSQTPGGAIAVQRQLAQGMATPEGQAVESIYNRTGLGQPPQAAQAFNPQEDAIHLQRSMAAFMQRGMSLEQAQMAILQGAQKLGPAAMQRVKAAMQYQARMSRQGQGDRILATQVGR